MIGILNILLPTAGAGLLLLAILHLPIGKKLKWAEDARKLTPVNQSIFHVHTFFICLVLVLMGLPCLLEPAIFLNPTRAGAWMSWSFAVFWLIRLYFQWFVYQSELWRAKPLETAVHVWFTLVWAAIAGLFTTCGLWQAGWLST